jgi:hypothetical protein
MAPITGSETVSASSKNTSLNSVESLICRIGRTVTPAWCIGTMKAVIPRCPLSGPPVRASRKQKSAIDESVVHTF